ncbi:MAG: DEAD/DEAH box helicase [Nanoarchaeota archaeon]|nr:DEAD/DEAH box helicase [Nanoarchaeota archaeon]
MKYKNFTLDPFQEQAIEAIESRSSVVVSAPTGSGKTLIADYIVEKHKNDPQKIIYTAPIKALSNQKYKDFSHEYGEENVGLMTGDIVINPTAKIIVMTTEIYRNMVISKDESIQNIAYVIFDEIHYINDIERGYVWEESIIYSPESIRFLCLSATIPNADEFSSWIQAIKKHPVKTIVSSYRNVPLEHAFYDQELGITTLKEIKSAQQVPQYRDVFPRQGKKQKRTFPQPSHLDLIKELGAEKLPCLYFSFSRKSCQIKAQELARQNLFQRNPTISQFFSTTLSQAPSDVQKLKSTLMLKETLPQGIAFHHAGLLPVIKEAIEDLFGKGLIKVLYTTETFAVGINMPAKTVCFDSLRKYDGFNFRYLNTKEYFQIAGRAGRRGIDTVGYVVSVIFRPTFRYEEIKRITTKDIEPIKSQFKLSINTVLNLINQHTPAEIEQILRLSFFSYQKFGKDYAKIPTNVLLARYSSIIRKLTKYDYVQGNTVTAKGVFSSKIFADEISIGEIFATDFVHQLDEYQILLLLAALIYEKREMNKFTQEHKNDQLNKLKALLSRNDYLSKEKKFLALPEMTTLMFPIYHGKSFFDLLSSTTLLEGDLIRFFLQIKDRIGQIKKATVDYKVTQKMINCQGIIDKALEGIYVV